MIKKLCRNAWPLIAAALVLGTLAAVKASAQSNAAPAAPADTTLQGEVLDLACYMGHGAAGSDHAQCAKKCLMGANAAGLMTADGSVTLLVKDHKKEKVFKGLCSMAGEQVKVTGTMSEKGGLKALMVTSAEKVK